MSRATPAPAAPPPREPRWATYGPVALLILLGVLVYAGSFGGVLQFDDRTVITENASIRAGATWVELLSPPPASGASGRPVANLAFALNYRLGGLNLWGYHAFNLGLHLASALLLFALVRRTLLLPTVARPAPVATGLAVAISALWLVHPLHTSVVTYLSQRTEALMGFFTLATLYAFVRATAGPRLTWGVVAAAACALGMASKQSMVTSPLLVFLYDRTFISGSFRAAWRRHRGLHLALAASWLVLALGLLRLKDQSVGYGLGVAWTDYALTEARALCLYLKLCVYPAPLVFDYGPQYLRSLGEAAPYLAVVALALGATILALCRRPTLGFLPTAFFLWLAPSSSVVPVALQPIAENRLYLPATAAMTLLVLAADRWLGRHRLWPALVSLALLTALWGSLTVHRNTFYHDPVALWQDTVDKVPANGRAHYNLGLALHDARGPEAARPSFERAAALQPNSADAWCNLGLVLNETGHAPEALAPLQRALRLQPGHFQSLCNLGFALTETGRPEEAIPLLDQALRLRPAHFDSLFNLGNALLALGRYDEAIARFESALRLNASEARLHTNLAFALLKTARLPEALPHFAAAVRLEPTRADWHFNHAIALSAAGHHSEAIAECQEALRLDPQHAKARDKLERMTAGSALPSAPR